MLLMFQLIMFMAKQMIPWKIVWWVFLRPGIPIWLYLQVSHLALA